ncbi:hypothetical protein Droror1_Dr00017613, partial [Drosera rotundifolia]
MGLKDNTDALLKGLHIEYFASSRWLTYEKVVLEFLSTLELITTGKKKEDDVLPIQFWLGGMPHQKTITWVNHLTGLKTVEFKTTKVSVVHNPVFWRSRCISFGGLVTPIIVKAGMDLSTLSPLSGDIPTIDLKYVTLTEEFDLHEGAYYLKFSGNTGT